MKLDEKAVLRQAEELGSIGTFLSDYAAGTMTMSLGLKRILGLGEQVTSITLSEAGAFVHPEDIQDYALMKERAVRSARPLSFSYRLMLADGRVKHLKTLSTYTSDGSGNALYCLGTVMDVTDSVDAISRASQLAEKDWLTDLPNRRGFLDKLDSCISEAAAHGKRLAVFLVDIDAFTKLNDSLGHAAGDQVLREFANRLVAFNNVYASRIGGDTFGCMAVNIGDELTFQLFIQELHAALSQPVLLNDQPVAITCALGLAVFPDDGLDVLVQKADIALYRAKHQGRGVLCRYKPDIERIITNQYRIERDLYSAFSGNQFRVFYQPIVDAASKLVSGVEALLRWEHPDFGLLGPESFLEGLEDTGAINDITAWMFRTACTDLSALEEATGTPVRVSINLSPQQLLWPRLLRSVRDTLEETRVSPDRLGFEMTEQTLIRDVARASRTLKRLSALGISITIDDFGTGYNTLAHLKDFSVHCLKIDKSFVKDIVSNKFSRAICNGVIALAAELNLRVIAEGVETEAQAALLTHAGCGELQGFLYGRPVPKKDFVVNQRVNLAKAVST